MDIILNIIDVIPNTIDSVVYNFNTKKYTFFFTKIYYFNYSFNPSRVNIKKLSKNYFSFLGYFFSIKTKNILVSIKMIQNLKKSYIKKT